MVTSYFRPKDLSYFAIKYMMQFVLIDGFKPYMTWILTAILAHIMVGRVKLGQLPTNSEATLRGGYLSQLQREPTMAGVYITIPKATPSFYTRSFIVHYHSLREPWLARVRGDTHKNQREPTVISSNRLPFSTLLLTRPLLSTATSPTRTFN